MGGLEDNNPLVALGGMGVGVLSVAEWQLGGMGRVWLGEGARVEGAGWLWAPEWGAKPIFTHHPQTCGMSFIHEKWHKLRFALFGVTINSFLGGFLLQLSDVQYCDHCGLYLGRDQTALAHRYINC
jgi:hypothetical protein